MDIRNYELFEVPPRWVFLRIETSTGVVGWGEPIVEGHAKTMKSLVENIMDNYFLGKDPLEIERHWQALYRGRYFRGGPMLMSAIGGIDQALWDIKGKHYDAPVYDLLGGRACDKIRPYQWIGGETPAQLAAAAAAEVDNGYTVLKMPAVTQFRRIDTPEAVETARERVEAVRETVGQSIDVGVDFRGRVTKGMAKWVAEELDQYDPMFYEEPVLPQYFHVLPRLEAHTKTPLASGERLYSRWDFRDAINSGYVDIVQPSISHAGGLTEVKKIATAAEAADVLVAPHCPIGPIAFASAIQVDMTIPNAIIQSQNLDIHDTDDNDLLRYLDDPDAFGFENGYVTPPDSPGLGIEIDETEVRQQTQSLDWQNPIWYHEDGSVAEW